MKLFYELDHNDICIVLSKKEARQFDDALQAAMSDKKTFKPLNKRSAAYKIINQISDLMPIW